jgi:hypothetical protein
MEINDLITMLTEGLDPADAAVVRRSIERDAVKAKATTLKQQSEYDALNSRLTAMQQEMEDQGQPGQAGYKAGAKTYAQWYQQNYPKIQKLQDDMAKYQAKFGTLEAPTTQQTPPAGGKQFTDAEIQALVDQRIQQQYSPRWSELLMNTGDLVQRHMFAGRKTKIDFPTVSKLAAEKYNGNLDQAYDEWDKPEREKELKAAEDARVEQRVKDELAKRGAGANFPAAADFTPSSLSNRTKSEVEKYDPQALKNDLAREWATGSVS